MKGQCKSYVGVACVNGTCPIARADEYEEYCMPVQRSCNNCWYYKGCEDCAFEGTEDCEPIFYRR